MPVHPSSASRIPILALRIQFLLRLVVAVLDAAAIFPQRIETHPNHTGSTTSCEDSGKKKKHKSTHTVFFHLKA